MSPHDLETSLPASLAAVRDAVQVPEPDRIALRARVRDERRRRTTTRAAVGLAAAAVVAAVAGGVSGVLPTRPDAGPATTDVAAQAVAAPTQVTGFVLDGRLVVGTPGGGYEETDVPARSVVGVLDGVLAVVDTRGVLRGVGADEDGVVGPDRRLWPEVVDHFWYDAGSGVLTVQDQTGTLHQWAGGDAAWTDVPRPTADDLYLVDGDAFVESGTEGMTLRNGNLVRRLRTGGGVLGGDLVGGTLALATTSGLRFHDAATGRVLSRVPGEWPGALTPDGAGYVMAARDGTYLVDTRTGQRRRLDAPSALVDPTWTSADTFVARAPDGENGSASLWECRTTSLRSTELYTDPAGTIELAK